MAYKIERYRYGVVVRFSGVATYTDVLRSEQEIHSDSNFTRMRYIISDYSGTEYQGLTESQLIDVNALRIGGHYTNPRIKYAFVSTKPAIQSQMSIAIANGYMLHQARIFDTFNQAAAWVGHQPGSA